MNSPTDERAIWGDELLESGDPLGELTALARKYGEPDEGEEQAADLIALQEAYEREHLPSAAERTLGNRLIWT